MYVLVPSILVFTACSGGEVACGPGTHDVDGLCLPDETDADTDTDTDTDTDADTDTDTDADTDTDTDTDPAWTVCADGSAPYADVQDAIDDASDGAVITVCDGTYDYVEIRRLDVTLIGAGTDRTTIDGGSRTALSVEDSTFAIEGFTLLGAPDSGAGGLWLLDCQATIRDVRFAGADGAFNTWAAMQGGTDSTWEDTVFEDNAMSLFEAYGGGSLVLRHSVFRDNRAPDDGSGGTLISVGGLDSYEISNNLFYGNTTSSNATAVFFGAIDGVGWVYNNVWWGNDHGGAEGLVSPESGVIFENNIVANTNGGGIAVFEPVNGLAYSDSFGNSGDDWGTNHGDTPPDTCITADARFLDPESADFHLLTGFSPAEDGGDPLSGYNDVDGSRNDMGAFGGPHGDWTP